jgi:D-glycero-D-manno-heptose 1,7-bisphosphate phosphatase
MREWPEYVTCLHPIAVFLDRDGTLNVDAGWVSDVRDFRWESGAIEGLRKLSNLPVHLIVVTNQSGIALGKYTAVEMAAFHQHLRHEAATIGTRLDGFYFAPEFDEETRPAGQQAGLFAKPAAGMLLEAARDFGIDLRSSFMIGDKRCDALAGRRAGCKTILLQTGHAGTDPVPEPVIPDHIAPTLSEAADWISERIATGNSSPVAG